jgi:hypothetical protein
MNADDYARRVHERLTQRVTKQMGLFAHVADTDLRKLGHELRSPFTDAEKEALFAALRAVATEDALQEVLVRHVYMPAWNHWWAWLLEHWEEVEGKVEYERGRAERCRAYFERLRTDPVFAAQQKMRGHWKLENSEKVLTVWEALKALREADEIGVGVDAALEGFHDAQERDGGNWWDHVTNYWQVTMDWHTALLLVETWLEPTIDTLEKAKG